MMPYQGAVGGAAGEQGSLHRNGVAAYLAVYGLVGIALAGRPGAIPTRIQLEGDAAVDDIVCRMEDDSTWYMQSKRTAGNDKALRAAIKQWGAQDLQPADRIVLVSRELRGLLKDLQPLIDQFSTRRASIGKTAQARIEQFSQVLESEGVLDTGALIEKTILLECAVESSSDAQFDNAVAMLAGTIVEVKYASAAFEALRGYMQHVASRREWSGPEDWVRAITKAGIPVLAEPEGVRGARIQADIQALGHYRQAISKRLDTLDLSALKPGLGHINVKGLLRGWKVELRTSDKKIGTTRTADIWNVVRRNPRFVITGLPGIGKSEALRQIAAAMADDDEAPVPVLVDLRDILSAVRRSEDVTLDVILDKPSRGVPNVAPEEMAAALRSVTLSGLAVLIVDGLDEARRARGSVAEGFRQLLKELPSATGFILSTRPSAIDAVSALGLPTVELRTPERLDESLEAVLTALSEKVAPDAREAWLADRLRTLRGVSNQSGEIWKVPLLATLATLRIGSQRSLAFTPADLLNDVVADSVMTWEASKTHHQGDIDSELRAEMLLDGFISIGRKLSDSGTVSVPDAVLTVAEDLGSWNLSQRLTALLAGQVVHFWDERVGVFVEQDGHLVARSRLFSELADALWAVSQVATAKQAWLAKAIADPDKWQAVSLASSKDSDIRSGLLDLAQRGTDKQIRSRAVTWTVRFWDQWEGISHAAVCNILHVVADAAEDMGLETGRGLGLIEKFDQGRHQSDEAGWDCVVALANANLSDDCQEVRDQRLDGLDLSDERRELISLIVSLRNAGRAGRELQEAERSALEKLLYGARPAPSVSRRNEDGIMCFETSEGYINGVDTAIGLAVEHVEELGSDAPQAFFALARRLSMSVYEQVATVLESKGYKDTEGFAGISSVPAEWSQRLGDAFSDHFGLGWLLRQVSSLYEGGKTPTGIEAWRYQHLADFISALEWSEAGFGETDAAAKDPDLLNVWFSATVEAYNLNGPLIAGQAGKVLNLPQDQEKREAIGIVVTESLSPITMVTQVDCTTATNLVRGFSANSFWIAEKVLDLVVNAGCPKVSSEIAKLPGRMYWRSRYLATIASIANAERVHDAIREAENGDSATRSGLAVILPQLETDFADSIKALASDPNATVRHHAGHPPGTALIWTCTWCYEDRDIKDVLCPKCRHSPSWSTG